AVGYGRLSAPELVRSLRGVAPEPAAPARARRSLRRPRSAAAGVRVGGQSDVMVRFARCCAPLPGDDVVGFVTRGRGVTVHVRECPHTFALDRDRCIAVAWEPKSTIPRQIRVRIVSVDQPGVLARITKSISSAGVNIGAAQISTTDDQTAVHEFDLWVADLRSLNAVMKEIGKVRGVHSVERVRG
ncbi:MAG TPA: ACT domain-containing protein, partial [Candidatus Acidoferrales bacterium]|nr:ACT domain-containing protein [Candidatus Acidoferrales bacterium]